MVIVVSYVVMLLHIILTLCLRAILYGLPLLMSMTFLSKTVLFTRGWGLRCWIVRMAFCLAQSLNERMMLRCRTAVELVARGMIIHEMNYCGGLVVWKIPWYTIL